MSFAEQQEIMDTMRELIALLEVAETKVGKIDDAITGSGGGPSLRKEMRVMNMYMIALQKWSGSDTLSNAVNKIQDFIRIILRVQMLLISIQKIQTIMAAAKVAGSAGLNPFAWLELGANAIGLGMSVATLGQ